MKIYVVGYWDAYDAFHIVSIFSTETKANNFIETAKKQFYKGIVLYDYRGYDLCCDEFDLDEFDDVMLKNK